jgi:hypothetical protein
MTHLSDTTYINHSNNMLITLPISALEFIPGQECRNLLYILHSGLCISIGSCNTHLWNGRHNLHDMWSC